MAMLNDQVAAQTKQVLAGLRAPVRILFFTEGAACNLCGHVAAAAPRLTVEAIDAASFADLVVRHRIGAVARILLDDTVDLPVGSPPAELITRIAAGS